MESKQERERIAKLRQEKWDRIQKAFPPNPGLGIAGFIQALNKQFVFKILDSAECVVRQTMHPNGLNAKIVTCKIGGEYVIGSPQKHIGQCSSGLE